MVKADRIDGVPLKLRYTLDGSIPNLKSPIYSSGVPVDKPCTVTFAYVNGKGQTGETAQVDCRQFVLTDFGPLVQGLDGARHLLGSTTSKLPDLARMKANSTFKATEITESDRPRPTGFGVAWTGFLSIPQDGAYTFTLTSDDGSVLRINDAVVVDNDGPHGAVAKSGTALLKAGTYKFYLAWFDQGGANSLKVEMEGPNVPKAPIPASWFWRPNAGPQFR